MGCTYKTIDLFAGPGGLAEGFSTIRNGDGDRVFPIALSVEKEPSAFATLRLRSFFRQFESPPEDYDRYLAGQISKQDLIDAHPDEWARAVAETAMLELGSEQAAAELDERLSLVESEKGVRTVVIGGPPCQAYSLVGRARNKGIAGYDPAEDHRHFLYREYIGILQRLQPAAFVMENVKGLLSARVAGERIIEKVLADLETAGGGLGSYVLFPLVDDDRGGLPGHLIRSENFGIPQCRHRVILLGLRRDIADVLPDSMKAGLRLQPVDRQVTVRDAISRMPELRSGLSRGGDSPGAWVEAAIRALRSASAACREDGDWLADVQMRLLDCAMELASREKILPRTSRIVTPLKDNALGAWISKDAPTTLPNHESRGHMEGDLARYAFAAAFAEVFERSPKAGEFPKALAPDHGNWESGKFADRFRVQAWGRASTTVTSHISKDGHYFIHPDPMQCRSLTVREAARLQTFPDNYFFEGNRTQQYVQVGNAVPPLLARQIAEIVARMLGAIS
ncbi:DNA cytosine methyltransferase [Novosphingobium decolorationis]|uniref:DNA (cytosine-5-)-methyltransferase n=2 Tax=Novosphingobium decolorationis TaxID=2698673 RepID=A0ABX8EE10_9SPHN|nr:DNA cytosine methyltransferase [Novosphingobium decolorationis]